MEARNTEVDKESHTIPDRPVDFPSLRSSTPQSIFLHLGLLLLALLYLTPFLWLICACFKQGQDVFRYTFLPWSHLRNLTLDNFRVLFSHESFSRWLINSLFISSVQTLLVVTFSSLGGFALAKYEFRGKRLLMLLMLSTMLLPGVVLLSGYIDLMVHIGWINSYKAIILPGAASAFGMFLFRQAMLGVPDELLHAGRVDGCSELRLWWDVALPVVRPMVGAFTLLSFLASWNSYLWPSTILQDQSKFTIPMGLAGMVGLSEYESQYGVLMAGTLIGILPVTILFFVLQKDFVAGLASGAVKG
jgi:ABC-type glycerol-3-phosphate transport system permease component